MTSSGQLGAIRGSPGAELDAGYAIIHSVLTRWHIDTVIAGLTTADLHRTRAGARHLMSIPAIRELAHDPRLLTIARASVGESALPFRATLFDKSPDANWLIVWHQDTALPLVERRDAPGWGPWSVKAGVAYAHAPARALERVVALRLSLDDSGPDNGPLRVLPGVHTIGVLTEEAIADLSERIQPVDCCVRTGGIVTLRPLTVHASSKATSDRPRRVLHIEYIDSLDLGDGLQVAVV
jgi:ectoine hydroxylase-related dioxygenase (phytanoyl-CoA dioxygenase family)